MSTNSRQKGKRGERQAVLFLRSLGFDAHRTAQNRGKTGDCADVEIKGCSLHIEVKMCKGMGLGTKMLDEACAQAAHDAICRDWVVLWWEHRKGWRLTSHCSLALTTVHRPEDIKLEIQSSIEGTSL